MDRLGQARKGQLCQGLAENGLWWACSVERGGGHGWAPDRVIRCHIRVGTHPMRASDALQLLKYSRTGVYYTAAQDLICRLATTA